MRLPGAARRQLIAGRDAEVCVRCGDGTFLTGCAWLLFLVYGFRFGLFDKALLHHVVRESVTTTANYRLIII